MLSLDPYVLLDRSNLRLSRVHVTFGLPFWKGKKHDFWKKARYLFWHQDVFPAIFNIKLSNFSGYISVSSNW